MTKHVLIQAKPPKEDEVGQHPLLPNPAAELPIQYGENPKDLDPYREAGTGKLKTGGLAIMDRIFLGIPLRITKEDKKDD